MSLGSIELCSAALNKIGASEITSFNEGTAEAELAASVYPLAKRKLLSSHPWSFALRNARLNRTAQAEEGRDEGLPANRFQLPNDFLRAVKILPAAHYTIRGDGLWCGMERVTLEYVADAGEDKFPPLFASALTLALAAEFALALLDDGAKFNTLQRQSMLDMREARLADAQQSSPKKIRGFQLAEARE